MNNCIAANVAQPWSDHMHATARLYHNQNVGSQVQNCTGRPGFGENVGRYRYSDLSLPAAIEGLDSEFWASSGHRSNVLGNWSSVGVAVTSGHNGVYITLAFAR
jgi:uncharacterized protein YkwD